MGQKQDELLKRIQKLVKKNQDLLNSNEKLRRAVNELTEKNEISIIFINVKAKIHHEIEV